MKYLSILIIVLLVVLFIGIIYLDQNYQEEKMDIGGIEISSSDYSAITNPLPEGYFNLCSIEQNKCVRMVKRGLG